MVSAILTMKHSRNLSRSSWRDRQKISIVVGLTVCQKNVANALSSVVIILKNKVLFITFPFFFMVELQNFLNAPRIFLHLVQQEQFISESASLVASQLITTTAFTLFKAATDLNIFGGQGYTQVFVTDESKAKQAALSEVWPDSLIKLCLFHVQQAVWHWLWETNHGMEKSSCKLLMGNFQQLVRCNCGNVSFRYIILLTITKAIKYSVSTDTYIFFAIVFPCRF